MKRKLLIGTLASAVFLFLALRDVDWIVLWGLLKQTRVAYLVPTVFFTMLGHYFRAYRWKFMMLPVKRISTHSLFSATAIGFMANNLLPARLGELVRAYILGRQEDVSRTASFASIVYERIVDLFSLIALLWFVLLKATGPQWLRSSGIWLLVVNIGLLVGVYLVVRNQTRFVAWLGRVTARLPENTAVRVAGSADSFVTGLSSVSKPQTILPVVTMSVLVWLCAILGLYYTLLAMNMQLPFLASVTLVVVVSLGAMIPSAPAYVGTLQYACIVGLGLFGVGKSEALAYSLVYHATQFVPITVVGLFYLWKNHIGLRELSKTS